MWAFHPKIFYSFSKIKKIKKGHAHFLSQQLLEQQETERQKKVRQLFTHQPECPAALCSALSWLLFCFLLLFLYFFCLLVASLLHLHGRWDEPTDEIRSLCAAERSGDSCSDKSSSTLATDWLPVCRGANLFFFFLILFLLHMHECTTADKKTPKIHM